MKTLDINNTDRTDGQLQFEAIYYENNILCSAADLLALNS